MLFLELESLFFFQKRDVSPTKSNLKDTSWLLMVLPLDGYPGVRLGELWWSCLSWLWMWGPRQPQGSSLGTQAHPSCLNCPRAGKFLSHGSRWLSPPSARSPPQPRACGNFSRLSKLAPSNTLLFPSCSHRVPNKQACVTNNNGAGLSPW